MKKLYVLLFTLVCYHANAQWKYANYPLGGNVTQVASTSDRLFAVIGGTLFASSDKGDHWINSMNGLSNVEVVATVNNTVLVSTNIAILASTDNGNTWKPSSTGLPNSSFITAIAVDGQVVLAEALDDAIYKSTDGGATWRLVNAGDSSMFWWGVQHLAIHGNLALATTKAGVFISTDAGETWTEGPSGLPPYATCLAIQKTKMFVIEFNTIYVSADSGKTFNDLDADLPYSAGCNLIIPDGDMLYAGTMVGFYASADAGVHWEERVTNLPIDSYINAMTITPTDVFIGTTKNIFQSVDRGKNWMVKNQDVNRIDVKAMVSIEDRLLTGSMSGILVSDDLAGSWVPKNDGVPVGQSVRTFAASDSVVIAGTETELLISSDKGENWEIKSAGFPSWMSPFEVRFYNGSFYLSIYADLYTSSDNGRNWTNIKGDLPPQTVIYSIGFHNTALFINTYTDGIYKSVNNGVNWSQVNTGLPLPVWMDHFATVGDIVFVATDKGLYKTTDDGLNWSPAPGIPQDKIQCVSAIGKDILVSTDQDVYFSNDNGNSWRSVKDGLPDPSVHAFMLKEKTVYAATYQGVWYRSLSEITGISNNPNEAHVAVYPNPAEGLINISSSFSIRHIDVFNAIGECVHSLDANSNTLQLQLGQLAKGLYFLNIQSENKWLITKKISIH